MCCTRLTANTGCKKSRQKSPSGQHRTTLSGYIFANKACVDNRKKTCLLSSNISSTCAHNMVNFGPLAAEVVSLVWATPANLNEFGVLAALLHGTPVVGVSQTLRPSRWALAHILVFLFFCVCHSFLVFFAFVVLDLVSSVLSQYTELLSEVLCLSWHKTDHFRLVLPSQSLGLVVKRISNTAKANDTKQRSTKGKPKTKPTVNFKNCSHVCA